jgi:hypothetical protein
MNSLDSGVVPLQFASLCLDCEMITPTRGRCTACGSVAVLNVARMLSRPGAIHLPHGDNSRVADVASNRGVSCGNFLQST